MADIRGKHVLVTGASSGIGFQIAAEALRRGAIVTAAARRTEPMQALHPLGKTQVIQSDLTDTRAAQSLVNAATATFGPVDILVNNAGAQLVEDFAACDPAQGEKTLMLNVFTPLRLSRAVLPTMIERKDGVIIDIASLAALAPTPGMLYYNAGKAAIAAASESMRGELRGTGVHVLTVYPGPVTTPLAEAAYAKYEETRAMKMMPEGKPDELARLIWDAVIKRKNRIVYPASYQTARWFPAITRAALDRFTPKRRELPSP